MAKVVLDCPRILAVIGELVAAAMAQHVAVDQEPEPRSLARPRNHALIASYAQWRAALRHEDLRARSRRRLSPEPPQRSALLGANRMHASRPALGSTYVQFAGGKVGVVPTHCHKLRGP